MPTTFAQLGVRTELVELLRRNGLTVPTPVQDRTIPVLLAGNDAIAEAQTGTGKTLAFVLPILEQSDPDKSYVQALIITPTRELAIQITSEIKKLAPAAGLNVLAAYGGQDVEGQIRKLKNAPHIVVGTPGRLLDHLRRGTIDLSRVGMLVLDEADQMLAMGFLTDVEDIIVQTGKNRQTMLFSATMPDAVRRLASRYMRQPEDIRVHGERITLTGIKQFVVETTDRTRQQTLFQLLEQQRPFLAVVFCRTKIRAKKLTEELVQGGFDADELHGDLTQGKREQVMKRFREAKLNILVATDVAARGLDVEGVTHVFNYDVPLDAESYVHRIGRTGRAGQTGIAITLAAPKDKFELNKIERGIDAVLERREFDAESGQLAINREGRGKKAAGTPGGRGKASAGAASKRTAYAREAAGRDTARSRGDGPARGRRGAEPGGRGRPGRAAAEPGGAAWAREDTREARGAARGRGGAEARGAGRGGADARGAGRGGAEARGAGRPGRPGPAGKRGAGRQAPGPVQRGSRGGPKPGGRRGG